MHSAPHGGSHSHLKMGQKQFGVGSGNDSRRSHGGGVASPEVREAGEHLGKAGRGHGGERLDVFTRHHGPNMSTRQDLKRVFGLVYTRERERGQEFCA